MCHMVKANTWRELDVKPLCWGLWNVCAQRYLYIAYSMDGGEREVIIYLWWHFFVEYYAPNPFNLKLQINNLSAMEVNIVRPFVGRALQAFYKHDSPDLIPDQDRVSDRRPQVANNATRVCSFLSWIFIPCFFYCLREEQLVFCLCPWFYLLVDVISISNCGKVVCKSITVEYYIQWTKSFMI